MAVPYQPQPAGSATNAGPYARASCGRTLWSVHGEAAVDSARITGLIEVALQAAGIETYRLDGTQTLSLVWERLHPATRTDCNFDKLALVCQTAHATTGQPARAVRHRLVHAACDGAARGVDAGEDARWLCHADGTLEEALHLGSPPACTDPACLSYLLCCPLPATLAVQVGVGGRARSAVWPALPGCINHPRIPPRSNPQSTQGGFL